MARQQVRQDLSDVDKLKYYSDRVADSTLSSRERGWAKMRINQLSKKLSSSVQVQPSTPMTAQQQNAHNAGIGFGAAKVGARVPVAPENQQSFRDGVRKGRALAHK